jgi:hypothetical protein
MGPGWPNWPRLVGRNVWLRVNAGPSPGREPCAVSPRRLVKYFLWEPWSAARLRAFVGLAAAAALGAVVLAGLVDRVMRVGVVPLCEAAMLPGLARFTPLRPFFSAKAPAPNDELRTGGKSAWGAWRLTDVRILREVMLVFRVFPPAAEGLLRSRSQWSIEKETPDRVFRGSVPATHPPERAPGAHYVLQLFR